jgi:D-3-phosphoglycerate dehydrogenase
LHECKEAVVVVNASRGGIVNEPAMLAFLGEHPDAYYCSDVFVEEPYHGELVTLANVLLFPHIGASTRESRLEMELQAIENCERVLRGEISPNIVTKNL